MNFCPKCGASVSLRIPAGDHLPRHVCDSCNEIHYSNPKVVAGVLAVWEDKVLLCRRAIEPRYGLWTLPAGFMENNETTGDAAQRETREEACARVELEQMYTLVNVTHISQIHILYKARLLDLDFHSGPESLEVELFEEADIPWEQIAFRSVGVTLRHFFADRREGHYQFRVVDLPPPEAGSR
ncbi:MAG: NUDIX hydrolase [Moraxellaceae bacterium]|nr:NUDIX hydrolase [Moraxellaceae bacterium]